MSIELLAPSGNLEKAKIALKYGADAVYVGGKHFSLRARASNFDLEDLKELSIFAHELHKKVYVTMNIIPHDDDFEKLDEYLMFLDSIKIDAVIVSSLYIMRRVKELNLNIEVHVSTQTSILNSKTIEFYKSIGASRVVLARECYLSEIKKIKDKTDLELEVFIHGGMCSSFSGRCVLSNHFTNRDANRGGCAHSCRWNYSLYKNNEKLEDNKFFSVGSKDLQIASYIPDLIDIGVASLKIEGRMKSSYYLACVVSSYRRLIDTYLNNNHLSEEDILEFQESLKKCENRDTSIGFLNGLPTKNEQLYDTRNDNPTQEYVAHVISYNKETKLALVEEKNTFKVGDELNVLSPLKEDKSFILNKMYDIDMNELTDARHAMEKLYLEIPFEVFEDDMIRLIKK